MDVELLHRVGAALAGEAGKKNVDVVLGPTVNLHRSPLGGRHFGSFSEDLMLTAELGVAYVRGMQAEGVGATPKHYVANDSETDRSTVDVIVVERTLRELYLAPFDAIVHRPQPWLVMAAYNSINGPTATENPLLTDPLETEWGFDGVLVSDWTAVRSTEAAANAATDLALPGRQDEIVRVVAAANPRTVVVVNFGSPVELPWRDDVPAVVLGWFGGQDFRGPAHQVSRLAAGSGGRWSGAGVRLRLGIGIHQLGL